MNPARDIRQRVAAGLRQAFDDEQLTLLGVALVVGLAAGCCAVLFREVLALFQSIFLGTGAEHLVDFIAGLPTWQVVLAPTVGGLAVGIYLRTVVPRAWRRSWKRAPPADAWNWRRRCTGPSPTR